MKSILEELFYGNVCPNTACHSKGKETKELMEYIAKRNSLTSEFINKQNETLESASYY